MESARFAASLGARECSGCRQNPPLFTRAVAFGMYDAELRELLQSLKFAGVRRAAEHILGECVAEAALQLAGEAGSEMLVVPVPLHRDREHERGFNQAALLASAAVRRLRTLQPAWQLDLRPKVLRRTHATHALYALGPEKRRRSLKKAFAVPDAAQVKGREVLLVDDILTTGATANACAEALLAAGAAKVWVVTAARAQPESIKAVADRVARWDTPSAPLQSC